MRIPISSVEVISECPYCKGKLHVLIAKREIKKLLKSLKFDHRARGELELIILTDEEIEKVEASISTKE